MFLGAIPLDANFTVRVAWTPASGSPDPSGSEVTFVHEIEGDVVGPLSGDSPTTNVWEAEASLPKRGRWRVKWATSPPGGYTNDVLYVQ